MTITALIIVGVLSGAGFPALRADLSVAPAGSDPIDMATVPAGEFLMIALDCVLSR